MDAMVIFRDMASCSKCLGRCWTMGVFLCVTTGIIVTIRGIRKMLRFRG